MTSSKIKYLGIDKCFERHQDRLLKIYSEIGCSGQVVGGPHVEEFENNCKSVAQRKHAVSVANASDGVYFALKALGVGAGDEVLTPAYSFHATAESILRTGATPIFVDVDEHYHLDITKAEEKLTEKTTAIVVVNLFGDCMDFDLLTTFTNKHNLFLIEDAAQSLFSYYNDTPSGKLGHISVYSFAPSKNIHGFSHGGCVLTDMDEVDSTIRSMKLHGKTDKGYTMLGYNSIMSSLEAGHLNYLFKFADVWQRRRTTIANRYIEGLNSLPSFVGLPLTRNNTIHSWHKFVIRVDNNFRDDLRNYLLENNIESGVHYPTITPQEPLFNDKGKYDNASLLAQESLSLPIHPELTNDEVDYVINVIRTYFGNVR